MYKQIKIWSNRIITLILILVLAIILYSLIITKITGSEPSLLGYQIKTVLSGSMEPGIKTGSIIAIRPVKGETSFQKGDIISFLLPSDNNMLVTHRIIKVQNKDDQVSYVTKGDNNQAADSETVQPANIIGKYTGMTIPFIGYLINFGQSKLGSALLLILPGLIIFSYSFINIWKAIQQVDHKQSQEDIKEV